MKFLIRKIANLFGMAVIPYSTIEEWQKLSTHCEYRALECDLTSPYKAGNFAGMSKTYNKVIFLIKRINE